jgi:hypothetical protein
MSCLKRRACSRRHTRGIQARVESTRRSSNRGSPRSRILARSQDDAARQGVLHRPTADHIAIFWTQRVCARARRSPQSRFARRHYSKLGCLGLSENDQARELQSPDELRIIRRDVIMQESRTFAERHALHFRGQVLEQVCQTDDQDFRQLRWNGACHSYGCCRPAF